MTASRKRSFKTWLYSVGFAGPAMLCFVCVLVVPFLYGFYLTFTDWDGISPAKQFVGAANYFTIFTQPAFWQVVGRTVVYTAASVVLINLVAFALAYLVTSGVRGQNFFRAGFFTPNLIGGLVLGYVWQFVFARVLVSLGGALHIGFLSTSWLSDPYKAMLSLIIVTVWQYSGFMMLIYIAGLAGIPRDLIEAATIDGCTRGQVLRHITLPLLQPTTVICVFLSITRCFMAYDLNLSLTAGDPFGSTVMAAMYVNNKAFIEKNYGEGQTAAVILFVLCAGISLAQVAIGRRKEANA